jgi:hypothetical protein
LIGTHPTQALIVFRFGKKYFAPLLVQMLAGTSKVMARNSWLGVTCSLPGQPPTLIATISRDTHAGKF